MEALELAILGDANANDIENVIMQNVLGNWGMNVNNDRPRFSLENFSNEVIKTNFRFERQDLYRLEQLLNLPHTIRTTSGNSVPGITGLCILLRRLAYLNRLKDLEPLFNLSQQSISSIANHVSGIVINHKGHLLSNLQNVNWLNHGKLQYYAEAIRAKGAAIPNCWGFIDGTGRPICRPSIDQEHYYSGHKRFHCVKYQSVMCPDGIIVSLKGGYPGRRHDAGIFRDSNLYNELQNTVVFDDAHYVLYGDQAYPLMDLLMCPYGGYNLEPYQQLFNNSMSTLRTSVEWGFQKIVSESAFLDFKKNQKLLLQDLENMYKAGVLLTNCHTCLYHSQTSTFFNTVPPTIEEYLH